MCVCAATTVKRIAARRAVLKADSASNARRAFGISEMSSAGSITVTATASIGGASAASAKVA